MNAKMNQNTIPEIPEIIIKYEVYRKIKAYANLCNNEISALGTVSINENTIVIEDVYLFEQVVSGVSTELSAEDISRFICEYIKKGKDPLDLKFWWHSHVNMGAFWSSTDLATINKFSSDWMISLVSNKQDEFKLRLDIFSPFRMCMDNLPYSIEYDKSFNPTIQKEINQKVKSYFSLPYFSKEAYASYPPQYAAAASGGVTATPVSMGKVKGLPNKHQFKPRNEGWLMDAKNDPLPPNELGETPTSLSNGNSTISYSETPPLKKSWVTRLRDLILVQKDQKVV